MKSIKLKSKNFLIRIWLAFLVLLATILLILNLIAPKIPLLGFHTIIDIHKHEDRPFEASVFQSMNYFNPDMEVLLDYLVSQNYWFISAQDLYDYFLTKAQKIPSEHIGQKPIMLSFDDGYKNVYTNLLPMLEKIENKYGRKVKVVLFVNPGTLADYQSNSSIHMTCKDLRAGLEKGFYDIQSHGLNHKKLTDLDTQDLIREVAEAQVKLRECTQDLDPNKTVASHLAYPYGASNKKVEEYALKYYLSGYLYNSRIMKLGWVRNNYQIPRLSVNWKKSPSRLIQMAESSSKLTKTERR